MIFLYVGLALVALIAVYNFASNKDREASLLLKSTPWADIGEAPTGVDIRLSGRLEYLDGGALMAPMSGRKCAAWRLLIEEEFREGLRSGEPSNWKKVVDEFQAVDFRLVDETGHARVESEHVVLVADYDANGGAELFREIPENLEALLMKRGVHRSSWWSSESNFRYRESALEEGEVVTVAGSGRWENDPHQKAGYRSMAKVFRLGPLASGELVAADSPSLIPDKKLPGPLL